MLIRYTNGVWVIVNLGLSFASRDAAEAYLEMREAMYE